MLILSLFLLILIIAGCATPSILVTQEQNRGDEFFNQHNYNEALQHYSLMIDASSKLGIYRNLSMESEVQRKIANCYEMNGQYEKALHHVQTAMALDSAERNILSLIEDRRHEGRINIYLGFYQKSIASLEKSLDLNEGMDQSLKNINRLSIADTYLALGQLYAVMGRLNDSQDYTNRALAIYKKASYLKGEMESLLTLGSIFSDLGDFKLARDLTEQSLKYAKELKMGINRHLQLLSSISSSLGHYEDALRFLDEALLDARKFGISGQIIWTTISMGDIYSSLGDFKRAERYYMQAREEKGAFSVKAGSLDASLDMRTGDILQAKEYFMAEGSVTGAAISSLRYSEILIKTGKIDSAVIFLDQGSHLFREAGNKQGLCNVNLLKGRIMVDMDEYDIAKQLLDSASMFPEFPETVWQACYHSGRMYEKMGQEDKAIESYRAAISVIEAIRGNMTLNEFRSIYIESKRDVYDRLINILIKKGKNIEAFKYSEQARARAFYDILANKKIEFRGSMADDLVSLEQEKRIEIQKLSRLLQKENTGQEDSAGSRTANILQIRNTLMQAQTEYEELIQKIKLRNPAYAEMVTIQPVTLSELQAHLDNKTAVLTYWMSSNELILWLITRSDLRLRRVSVTTGRLTGMVEKARRSIQSSSVKEYTNDLSELYKSLIEPVENDLEPFSNLVIVPNGPLHFIPFQALMNSRGAYLVERFNLLYSPSASVYVISGERMIKTGSRFMGMALADVNVGNYTGLPGTEDELRKILPLFPDNISAFGNNCTETFVKKNAGNFNFIHCATHGTYNYRQPLYSCLLFPQSDEDDGNLNVYEVFELNLNAKLVTLSACETGLGNLNQGDEIIGLSRAFLFAGSAAVLVSLWSVADYPTALLMANFYSYLHGHNIQEALTLAQRDVIKVYKQPLYWSPFILVGNGYISAN
jgi:CHAT domain-containing protein/Tfp pilus assembly protein PilF